MKNIFPNKQKNKKHHSWKLKPLYVGIVILIVIIFLSSELFLLQEPLSGNSGHGRSNNINSVMATPFSGTNQIAPIWAFQGAYMNDSLHLESSKGSFYGFINFTIIKVNYTTESVEIKNSTGIPLYSYYHTSIHWISWNHIGIYALNNTILLQLNSGTKVPGKNITSIETGVYFKTQIGSFLSDMVNTHNSTGNSTIYIDENSGIPLSFHTTTSTKNVYLNITATNIHLSSYYITFTESGLPSGKSWSVTFNGTNVSATAASMKFIKGNGTYSFTVGTVSGYTASPSNGSMGVNGKNTTKTIAFSAVKKSKSTAPIFGLSPLEFYGIIGTVVVIAAIGSVIGIMKRKR